MYYYTIWIGFHFISFIWIAASVCDIGADTVGAAAVAAVAAVGAIGKGLAFVRIHCECDNKHVVAAAVVIMWVCVRVRAILPRRTYTQTRTHFIVLPYRQ